MVELSIIGDPKPQGSKSGFVNPKTGKVIITEQAGKPLKQWRSTVAEAAEQAAVKHGQQTGPLRVEVVFRLPMPKSRPATVRNAVSAWHTITPDVDKLSRALLDGLTDGGLIPDDKVVAWLAAKKVEVWGVWTGAQVWVRQAHIARTPTAETNSSRLRDLLADCPEWNLATADGVDRVSAWLHEQGVKAP